VEIIAHPCGAREVPLQIAMVRGVVEAAERGIDVAQKAADGGEHFAGVRLGPRQNAARQPANPPHQAAIGFGDGWTNAGDCEMGEAAEDGTLNIDEGAVAGRTHNLEDIVRTGAAGEAEVIVEFAGQGVGFGFQGIQRTRDLGGFGGGDGGGAREVDSHGWRESLIVNDRYGSLRIGGYFIWLKFIAERHEQVACDLA
jgi:hypothetical protein